MVQLCTLSTNRRKYDFEYPGTGACLAASLSFGENSADLPSILGMVGDNPFHNLYDSQVIPSSKFILNLSIYFYI